MNGRPRSPYHQTLPFVALAAAILAAAGAASAQTAPALPQGLQVDNPRIVPDGGETFVARSDAAEIEKASQDDPALLWFRNAYHFKTAPGIDPAAPSPLRGILLVQFPGPVRREWLEAVAKLGIVTHDHVQNHALLVEVPVTAAEGLKALVEQGIVRYVGPYPDAAKIAKELVSRGDASESSDESLVTVLFFGPPNEVRSRLSSLMAVEQESDAPIPYARGVAPASSLPALAALERVKWIERYEPGRLQNLEAAMSGAADEVFSLGLYHGTGIRVAEDDTGISRTGTSTDCFANAGAYHPDIASWRIADEWDFHNNDSNACDDHSHGTHVVGTLGGDGTLIDAWTGIAPGVTFLIYKDCGRASGFGHFDSVLSRAASHDADIVGNSWGGGAGSYDIDAQWADRAVRGGWNGSDGQPHPMFISAASCNDGDLACSPSDGKNTVSVGATKDGNFPDSFTCWGVNHCVSHPSCSCTPNPTCGDRYWPQSERICFSGYGPVDSDGDGRYRIKPDVVAPGTRIFSLKPPYLGDSSFYRFSDGTSMAQPVVAGTVALMEEAYPVLRGWPELAKARLLGTAMSLGSTNLFGHGLVDALNSVYNSGTLNTALWEGSYISGSGGERDHWFTVPSGFSEVRVYLTWSDPDSATTEVVNDLDLRLYDGAGTEIASSASWDDTVEYLRLGGGTPGTWRANVRGYNVPQPSAKYGIYAGVVNVPSSLSFSASPDSLCVKPGAWIEIESNLVNSGHSVPASETTIDYPAGGNFNLLNAEVHTAAAGRSHVYQAAEIRRDLAADSYTLYLGAVHPAVPRHVTWRMEPSTSAADGDYPLLLYGTGFGQISFGDIVDVRVDGTQPLNATNLVSTTHPLGGCWKQDWVWLNWTAGIDGGCGLDGYSYSWTQGAPGLPPESKMLEESSTVYAEPRTESVVPWYFNLRAVDDAGNWNSSAVSYGPFWVDYTPPGVVGALNSESHPAGACTSQPSVSMFWSQAPDDNCGTAGYSIAWTEGGSALPDDYADITLTDHLTSVVEFSDNPRYFNIRAVDAGGNASYGYAYHGPFWVDQVPGEIPSFAMARQGSDLSLAWGPTRYVHFYRVYKDVNPSFPSPVKVGPDTGATSMVYGGGATSPAPVEYFRVVGTNVCGKNGAM